MRKQCTNQFDLQINNKGLYTTYRTDISMYIGHKFVNSHFHICKSDHVLIILCFCLVVYNLNVSRINKLVLDTSSVSFSIKRQVIIGTIIRIISKTGPFLVIYVINRLNFATITQNWRTFSKGVESCFLIQTACYIIVTRNKLFARLARKTGSGFCCSICCRLNMSTLLQNDI